MNASPFSAPESKSNSMGRTQTGFFFPWERAGVVHASANANANRRLMPVNEAESTRLKLWMDTACPLSREID